MEPQRISTVAVLATSFYLVTIALFIGLHFSNSGYNIIEHAVSDYGVGRSARLFGLYAWMGNFGALALAYLFYASAQPGFPALIPLCMVLMVAARVGVTIFKTDLEGSKRTVQGALHYLFAILTFALAYTVIDNATPLLAMRSASDIQHWLLTGTRYAAMLSLVGVVITMFKPLRAFFGRTERVFLVSTLIWFLVASYSFVK